MSDTSGFMSWGHRPGKGNARLAGNVIEFQAEVGETRPLGLARIASNGGPIIHQARIYAADVPLLIEAVEVPLTIQLRNEEDFRRFERAVSGNHAVSLFLRGYNEQADSYSIAWLAAESATEVRLSRPVAYNGGTITQDPTTGYPPAIVVDGVDVSGDYTIPAAASGNAWDVVDVTGVTGTLLTIHYAKAPRCVFQISKSWKDACMFQGVAFDDPQVISGLE